MKRILVALIICWASALGTASGTTYYVSKSGSDSNSCGTAQSPTPQTNAKLTIVAGVACMSAGDTLLIHAGTYAGDTIDSSIHTVRTGTSGSRITISAYPGGLAASTTPGPRAGADVVVIQPYWGSKGISLTVGGPSYLTFQDLVIDQVNQTVGDAGGGPNGIYLSTASSNNIFLHLEVKNTGGTGIQTSTNNGSADNQQILYCSLHDNGLDASASNNGYGIYGATSGNIMDGNDIYENHGYGIQFNSEPSNNIVRNNKVHNNYPWNTGGVGGTTGGGITFQGDTPANPYGLVNDNQIYNNIVYENGQGGGGTTTGLGIQVYSWTRGTLVYNNTVYHQKGDGIALQYYDSFSPPIIRNNISYNNGGHDIYDYGDLNSMTGSPTIDHNTTSNPSFVNAAGGNFYLQSTSAAIDAGATIALVSTDFSGVARPQNSLYDLGAYEFISSLPVIPGAPISAGMLTRAAYGCGSNPTVYHVTSLADSGAGTFRNAVEASGPRVVIFERSGYIDLINEVLITSPCLTVAGQTAPSPGIATRMVAGGSSDPMISIKTHDVLIQHMAIRPGAAVCNSGMQAYGGGQQDIVLDHMSFSWGQDENLAFNRSDTSDTRAVVWRSIFAEGLLQAPVPGGGSGCTGGGASNGHGILVAASAGSVAVIQSVFASNVERNPYMQSDTKSTLVNNLIYQWHGPWGFFYSNADVDSTPSSPGPAWFSSAVGNRFVRGPHTTDMGDPSGYMFDYSINDFGERAGNKIYKLDNTIANQDGNIVLELNNQSYNPVVGSVPAEAPLPTGYTTLASTAVEAYLLPRVGARPADRDVTDTRILAYISDRSGNFIQTPATVGGYPSLAVNIRALTVPANPHTIQTSGYTTLEEWLHQYAGVVEGDTVPEPGPADVDPAHGVIITSATFTGAATTPLTSYTSGTGGSWALQAGSSGVWMLDNANRAMSTATTQGAVTLSAGVATSSQYDIDVDAVVLSIIPGNNYSIWGRSLASANTGYFISIDIDTSTIVIAESINASYVTLTDPCPITISAPSTIHFTFRMRDAGQHAIVNGTQCTSTSNNDITAAGLSGLSAYGPTADTNTTGIHFDNFIVTDVVSASNPNPTFRFRFKR